MFTKLHSAKTSLARVRTKSHSPADMAKKLAAFDFDHTIVDENSDLVARNLLGDVKIPESLKELYRKDGWTSYMQGIFDLLYVNKVKESTIMKSITNMTEVNGMKNLITTLVDQLDFDVIVISDSNSVFINAWLKANQLDSHIHRVFTNPAQFINGHLFLKMYHLQDSCNLSTKNLCKGAILQDFCKDKNYEQILFVGDGKNDFCPIIKLGDKDLACVRNGYKCADLIQASQNRRPIDASGVVYNISSRVCIWTDANDILKTLNADI